MSQVERGGADQAVPVANVGQDRPPGPGPVGDGRSQQFMAQLEADIFTMLDFARLNGVVVPHDLAVLLDEFLSRPRAPGADGPAAERR